eukprot:TRINITY_DN3976_c11_g1_i1.p1 TRINITY_DN3976_c11_g1~~TRINITY_DN3976_c11_g1_i1.p1  ORF type:complete len:311 (+),score=66.39 TRINITY_DN3976_c11_g1_i1:51-935(+)
MGQSESTAHDGYQQHQRCEVSEPESVPHAASSHGEGDGVGDSEAIIEDEEQEEVRFEDESEPKSEVVDYGSPNGSAPESIPTPQVALNQKFTDLSPSPAPVWASKSRTRMSFNNIGRESSVGPDGFGKVHKPGRIGLVYSNTINSPSGVASNKKKVGFQPPPNLPTVGGTRKVSTVDDICAALQKGVCVPSRTLAEERERIVNRVLCTRPCNRFTQEVIANEAMNRTDLVLEEISCRNDILLLMEAADADSDNLAIDQQDSTVQRALTALESFMNYSDSDSDSDTSTDTDTEDS